MKEEQEQPTNEPELSSREDYFERIYAHVVNPGEVHCHCLTDRDMDDFDCVREVAIDKAASGEMVYILPVLLENDPLYGKIFEGAKEKKCPDLKINGVYIEIKEPTEELTENKISKCIQNCHKQANHVIIVLRSKFNLYNLRRIINGRFKTHEDLEIVEVKMEEKYYTFTRQD